MMGLPEILFNLFPGMGAYSLLARRIGARAAEELILSGKILPAAKLHEMGVVDVLAKDGEGEAAVQDWIAKNARRRSGYAGRDAGAPAGQPGDARGARRDRRHLGGLRAAARGPRPAHDEPGGARADGAHGRGDAAPTADAVPAARRGDAPAG